MSTGFVPLSELVAGLTPTDRTFLSDVIKRDQENTGTDKAGILRRMQCEQCQACHVNYKQKFPGKKFDIKCVGIYGPDDYAIIQESLAAQDVENTIEEIRELYDPSYWGENHIVVKNDNGDVVKFVPRWYQAESLKCTSPRKVDRLGRGMGKRLNINTSIPTPSGWTTMGELKIGDTVFGSNGLPTKVKFVSDILLATETYNVKFSDGSYIHADAEHLWETWTHKERKNYSRNKKKEINPGIRTTKEIYDTLLHSNGKRIEHNHSVKVCDPLQYPKKVLLIPPYVLGVWLGDGGKDGGHLTGIDPQIWEEIEKQGYRVSHYKNPKEHNILGLVTDLRKLELLNNKFIPKDYLQSSVEQRLYLLQGLMDTDGNIRDYNWAEFDNTNKVIAEGVYELISSLGMKPTWREKRATLNGKDYGICYRIGFVPTMPVFKLKRKLDKIATKHRSSTFHRYIVSVEKAEPALMRCIEVDDPKHLYLAGKTCIPTHNTLGGIVEELHFLSNNKNTETLVLCPAKTQAELWWNEINFQIDNSPTKEFEVIQKKQQPYFYFLFANGSQLKIFTAGSKSGKGADSIRSQSPRRIRLEEQDYLAELDYAAIMPLMRRFKNVTFHGASTPTGRREMYWLMCNKFPDYKEFYHPIMDHPDWDTDLFNEEVCLAEAKTLDRYRHEWLAEFGEPEAGVFKSGFVDESLHPYTFKSCLFDPTRRYVMGIDWNGKGTGTRIVIIEYNPDNRKRRVVHHETIDDPKTTTQKSFDRIVSLNKQWHCSHVYVDAGFGFVQDELLKTIGAQAGIYDADTAKLKYVNVIDFGAKLETNSIIPNRNSESKYLPDPKDDILKRRTKPFMVEGSVMAFEMGLVEISREYTLLEEQLRGYRVKTWTKGGIADTYVTDCDAGDHDLDAFMLAMLGIELNYGLWHTKETFKRLLQIAHTGGWGLPSTQQQRANIVVPTEEKLDTEQLRELKKANLDVPSRTGPGGKLSLQDQYRLVYLSRQSYMAAPVESSGNKVGSRTGIFNRGQAPSGRNLVRPNFKRF